MTENCDDYTGYKRDNKEPEYIEKCGMKVWKVDEEMKKNLKCYDDAHSRQKCISEEYRKALEDQLNAYIKSGQKPLCQGNETTILHCVKAQKSLFACNQELESFLECVDESVKDIYQDKCMKASNKY